MKTANNFEVYTPVTEYKMSEFASRRKYGLRDFKKSNKKI